MILLKSVSDILIEFLNTQRILHFIGGSTRFGYSTRYSDFDIFICDSIGLRSNLITMGFKNVQVEHYKFSSHYRLIIGDSHIDAIILEDSDFSDLAKEHAAIEEALKTNPLLKDFIHVLKARVGDKLLGSDIYETLKHVLLNPIGKNV